MITCVYQNPNIYKIHVPLPDNPLRNLNCYVIMDNGEALIIDTGFNRIECKNALLEGLKELQIDWEKTNLFLTHLHSDHSGLAPAIMEGKPGKIYMSEEDHQYLDWILNGDRWKLFDEIYFKEGFTREQVDWLKYKNPARAFEPDRFFEAQLVADGESVTVGSYTFQFVFVPGHTPGQMCLYCPHEKLMFTADHILFDITPNITAWAGIKDSLGDYLHSLKKIRSFDMVTALPSHRANQMDVYERIDAIFLHHLQRLEETLETVHVHPYAHATKIGACLKWSMRGKTWDEFPLFQRWFAVGETMAHLDYLIERNLIEKRESDNAFSYHLKDDLESCKAKLCALWTQYK